MTLSIGNTLYLLLLAAMLAWMVRRYRSDARLLAQCRSQLYDHCASLLQGSRRSQDRAGLPVLQGEFAGYRVTLEVVEDTVAWRKLPPLWLMLTVHGRVSSHGSLALMARPANNEYWSPSWQWDGHLTLPPAWPQHALLKYRHQPADMDALHAHVPRLFADARVKELLIHPRSLRLTYLAKQANRGEYLIMRNAVYDDQPIARDIVQDLLQQAVAMRMALEQPQQSPITPDAPQQASHCHPGETLETSQTATDYPRLSQPRYV